MTTTRGVERYTLKRLAKLSGRSKTEILDDVLLGRLRACARTTAIDGDDHIRRAICRDIGAEEFANIQFTTTHSRIVWLKVGQASELVSNGSVVLEESEYPRYLDSFDNPSVKRYKRERVAYTEPYTATSRELRFLDDDAIHYIAKHTGRKLVGSKAAKALPRAEIEGALCSCIVYRLWADSATDSQTEPAEARVATSRAAAQENAVLAALRRAGYDPLNLPKPSGKPGPKAEIKKAVLNGPYQFTVKIFEKTWERLRVQGDIADK